MLLVPQFNQDPLPDMRLDQFPYSFGADTKEADLWRGDTPNNIVSLHALAVDKHVLFVAKTVVEALLPHLTVKLGWKVDLDFKEGVSPDLTVLVTSTCDLPPDLKPDLALFSSSRCNLWKQINTVATYCPVIAIAEDEERIMELVVKVILHFYGVMTGGHLVYKVINGRRTVIPLLQKYQLTTKVLDLSEAQRKHLLKTLNPCQHPGVGWNNPLIYYHYQVELWQQLATAETTPDVLKPLQRGRWRCWAPIIYTYPSFIDRHLPEISLKEEVFIQDQSYKYSNSYDKVWLAVATKAIRTIRVVPFEDVKSTQSCLPSTLCPVKLFTFLPSLHSEGHLVIPQLRPLLALISLQHPVLKSAAKKFFQQQPSWIYDLLTYCGAPTRFSGSTVFRTILNLIRLVPKQFIIEKERKLLDTIVRAQKVKANLHLFVEILCETSGIEKKAQPDYTKLCSECDKTRSFTCWSAMSERCGLCVNKVKGRNFSPKWKQCKECASMYVIYRPTNAEPRCYYCRSHMKPECITCECGRSFVCDRGTQQDMVLQHPGKNQEKLAIKTFECPFCSTSAGSVKRTVRIYDLLQENPQFQATVPVQPIDLLMSDLPLQQYVAQLEDNDIVTETIWEYKGAPIRTPMKAILSQLYEGNGKNECMLCASDVSCLRMLSPCTKCDAIICQSCFLRCHEEVLPGSYCTKAWLTCPFCTTPWGGNAKIPVISNLHTITWDRTWYYALCADCLRLEKYMEKKCVDTLPTIRDWRCRPCEQTQIWKEARSLYTKNCPSCSVTSVKEGGCDHIRCPCGEHWCWNCGKGGFNNTHGDPLNIYHHMREQHGY